MRVSVLNDANFESASDGLVRRCLLAVLRGLPLSPGELDELGVQIDERNIILENYLIGKMVPIVICGFFDGMSFPDLDGCLWEERCITRRWFAENASFCAKEHSLYFSEYCALIGGDAGPAHKLFFGSE